MRNRKQRGWATCPGSQSCQVLELELKLRHYRSCNQILTTDAWGMCPWFLSGTVSWSTSQVSPVLSCAGGGHSTILLATIEWDHCLLSQSFYCLQDGSRECACVLFLCPQYKNCLPYSKSSINTEKQNLCILYIWMLKNVFKSIFGH